MQNINIEIMDRRTGKTTKLLQLIEEELIKGEAQVILIAPNSQMLNNLIRRLPKGGNYKSYSAINLDINRLESILRGNYVKVFIDEINLIDTQLIHRLIKLIEPMHNIYLISYTS